ncbi:MAG: hypothetical protein IT423_05385, partial [Pirellulaceae bacterium]|nr:hypothetical protein [Pirellulaceae bacterium]
AVEDYGQRLPNPHYPVWEAEKLVQLQSQRGLIPWHAVDLKLFANDPALVSSESRMNNILSQLAEQLKQENLVGRDTLVVQLRGQAKVDQNPNGQYNLSLLLGESGSDANSGIGHFPIENLLRRLQAIPAQNILVLADICDLDYAPQIGRAVNPIASTLQTTCAKLKPVEGRNLWVLCAAADYQPAYVSHLRKRTLLQSACEFAMDKNSNDTADRSDKAISLAEFYDRVLRYASRATNQEQTPLLMRAGDDGVCLPDEVSGRVNLWDVAQNVMLARLSSQAEETGDKTGDKADDTKPVGNDAGNESGNQPGNQPASATGQGGAIADGSSPDGLAKPNQPLEPLLKYWQVRDQLQAPDSKWSPSQFAPDIWQEHQREFCRQYFPTQVTSGRSVEDRLVELEQLAAVINSQDTVPDSTPTLASNRLLSLYREFLADNSVMRGPWEEIEQLPKTEQERWKNLRSQYRIYADACASLPDWARWSRLNPSAIPKFDGLITELIKLHDALPQDTSALEQDALVNFNASEVVERIKLLRAELELPRREIMTILNAKQPKLSWVHERLVQQLLETPLLDVTDRQAIWRAWQTLQAKPLLSINQPDESADQITRGPLPSVTAENSATTLSTWFTAASNLTRLVNSSSQRRYTEKDSMLAWCQEFAAATSDNPTLAPTSSTGAASSTNSTNLAALSPQAMRLRQWHVSCLRSLFPERPATSAVAGIVVPASLSRAIIVTVANTDSVDANDQTPNVPFRSQSEMLLELIVQRADGSEVDEVMLSWKLLTNTALPSNRCLTISTMQDNPQQLLGDKPLRVRVTNRTVRLRCATQVDSRQLKTPLSVEIQTRLDNQAPESAIVTRLNILPKQPNAVELNVTRVSGQRRAAVQALDWGHALKIMAIKGAKSRYEFALTNLSSEAKRCVTTLYALPASAVSFAGPASTTGQASSGQAVPTGSNQLMPYVPGAVLDGLQPLAVSKPIDLPPADVSRGTPQSMELQPAPAVNNATKKPEPLLPVEYRWLYFHVQELGPDDKPLGNKPIHANFCRLDGAHPATSEVLVIEPMDGPNLKLAVKPTPGAWDEFGHAELPIKVEATDIQGRPMDAVALPVNFTREMSEPDEISLIRRGDKQRLRDLVAYLTIGGYPRAVAYIVGDERPRQQYASLAALEPASIKAYASNRKTVSRKPVTRQSEEMHQIIFPMNDEEGLISYDSLTFNARIDVPPNNVRPVFQLVDNATSTLVASQPISADRQYLYEFEVSDGFSVAATASDIRSGFRTELNGKLRLQIQYGTEVSRPERPEASAMLIFDGEPPEKADIRVVQPNNTAVPVSRTLTLYEGKSLTLRMRPVDQGSGIARVRMAIDGPGDEPLNFDEKDQELKGSLNAKNNEWEFVLDSESAFKASPSRLTIVAMSEDYAGNQQKAHQAVNVALKTLPKPPGASDQAN